MSASNKHNNSQSNGTYPNRQEPAQTNTQDEPQVAQIRQLIFGEQMTGYEERFAKLEKKLNDEIDKMRASVELGLSELKEATQKRSDAIESASVPRAQIAESLELLARTLRG